MDGALYFTITGIPYLALSMETGPVVLGLLPMAYSLTYSMLSGSLPSHTADRLRPARITLFLAAGAAAALTAADSVVQVFALMALIGFSLAYYWPPLQASIGDLSPHRDLQRNIGVFNVSWSLGKGMGFITGGLILQTAGFEALFAAAVAATLAARIMIQGVQKGAEHHQEAGELPTPSDHGAFRRAALAANFLAFGTVGLLNFHLPRHLETLNFGSAVFGLHMGMVMLMQTGLFWWLSHHGAWHYRKGLLLTVPLLVGASLILVTQIQEVWALLLTAPLLGLAVGFAYFSSIYYAVRERSSRGRYVGFHEAGLALGAVVLPLAGGLAAHLFEGTTTPFLFGLLAAAMAFALISYFLMRGSETARGTE